MDYYELHLLGLAVEKMGRLTITEGFDPGTVRVEDEFGHGTYRGDGPTLAEALAALLTSLGVTVPERVIRTRNTASGANIPALEDLFGYGGWTGSLQHLRDLYAREPLTVLALLEGGAS